MNALQKISLKQLEDEIEKLKGTSRKFKICYIKKTINKGQIIVRYFKKSAGKKTKIGAPKKAQATKAVKAINMKEARLIKLLDVANRKPRNTWLYELKDGRVIVYYGISNNPDRREIEQANSGKKFTHMNIIGAALTRPSAERRETEEIQRYQRQHGGRPPRYNVRKTL